MQIISCFCRKMDIPYVLKMNNFGNWRFCFDLKRLFCFVPCFKMFFFGHFRYKLCLTSYSDCLVFLVRPQNGCKLSHSDSLDSRVVHAASSHDPVSIRHVFLRPEVEPSDLHTTMKVLNFPQTTLSILVRLRAF